MCPGSLWNCVSPEDVRLLHSYQYCRKDDDNLYQLILELQQQGVSQILDPPLCMFYESMSSLFLISTLRTYTVLVESDAAKGTTVDYLASVILLRCSVDTTGERQFGDVELVL